MICDWGTCADLGGKVIGDPLYALNEFNLRWIAFSNWTYTSAPLDSLWDST